LKNGQFTPTTENLEIQIDPSYQLQIINNQITRLQLMLTRPSQRLLVTLQFPMFLNLI